MIICAKKEGVCWFPIEADGNAGMRHVKFARNYKGAIINYWGVGRGGRGDGRAGKFWGRAAIFWAPIYGGLTFSGPHLGEGYNFWAPLGDVSVLLNGFCATEILSTA